MTADWHLMMRLLLRRLLRRQEDRGLRDPLWDASRSIDWYAKRSPPRALQQTHVSGLRIFQWDDPLVDGIVFHVAKHLFVFLMLVVFCVGPRAVDCSSGHVGVHELPFRSECDSLEPWPICEIIL